MPLPPPPPAATLLRLYCLVVGGFTAWVGFFGFFQPAQILRALPWPLPPLHARVVGALYLSATLFLWLAALSRQRLAGRGVAVIALVWTGALLAVSLLHWRSFDPTRVQVWFWAGAYLVFPVAAAWLVARSAGWPLADKHRLRHSAVLVPVLTAQGLLYALLAVALGLWPAQAQQWWPWPLPPLLAQLYAGPLLGLGVGSLMLARRASWPEAVAPLLAQLLFAVLAALASTWHAGVFSARGPSQVLWWLALAALALAALAVLLLGGPSPRAVARVWRAGAA